ncbi:hypothetical protein LNV09_14690 [Paucibacter sp. B2R-40]|uniref:hypothetical protein n=1 Tax=Paucibacter sp. B2R-40 TaxID=2893554 RepID=UPI0021E4D084|nr:hypothetical protein [Paucibacter sp. B2R-40]MCV2355399.1 hypothetical protein [Paucibacter sp. B2R-40]
MNIKSLPLALSLFASILSIAMPAKAIGAEAAEAWAPITSSNVGDKFYLQLQGLRPSIVKGRLGYSSTIKFVPVQGNIMKLTRAWVAEEDCLRGSGQWQSTSLESGDTDTFAFAFGSGNVSSDIAQAVCIQRQAALEAGEKIKKKK